MKVLYLGASPPGTALLGLDEEVREIKLELRRARYRCFELVSYWTSEANDLIRELRESMPIIVQLAGHGCKVGGQPRVKGRGALRDVTVDRPSDGCEGGLVLHARDGSVHVVSYELVRKMFELAGSSVKLVVLTACITEPLARLLLAHVDCAIGMDGVISDRAAREFSKGLYAAIGDGASVEQAYKAGCVAIQCAGLPDADRPKLQVRDGVDASQIVLAVLPRSRSAGSHCGHGPRAARPAKRKAQRRTPRRG